MIRLPALMLFTSMGGELRLEAPVFESMVMRTKSKVMGRSWSAGHPPCLANEVSTSACAAGCVAMALGCVDAGGPGADAVVDEVVETGVVSDWHLFCALAVSVEYPTRQGTRPTRAERQQHEGGGGRHVHRVCVGREGYVAFQRHAV